MKSTSFHNGNESPRNYREAFCFVTMMFSQQHGVSANKKALPGGKASRVKNRPAARISAGRSHQPKWAVVGDSIPIGFICLASSWFDKMG